MIDAIARYLTKALEEVLKRPSINIIMADVIVLTSDKINIEVTQRVDDIYIINNAWISGNIWSKQYISSYSWSRLDLTRHDKVIDALTRTVNVVKYCLS
jgi:hypothetical protein